MIEKLTTGPRPPRWRSLATMLGVLVLGSSCDAFGPRDCTAIEVFGLVVRVYDDATHEAISDGLAGTATSGSHSEMLTYEGSNILSGASERPGTYDIAVSAPGYTTWTMEDVRVTADECHVRTQELEARLVAQSDG